MNSVWFMRNMIKAGKAAAALVRVTKVHLVLKGFVIYFLGVKS